MKLDDLIKELQNKTEKEKQNRKMKELVKQVNFVKKTYKHEIAETVMVALASIKKLDLEELNYKNPIIQALVKTCIQFGFVKGYEVNKKEDK